MTCKPLPFAQVCLQNSASGTAANDEGLFRLELPTGLEADTILVSFLGYKTLRLAIAGMAGRVDTIRLAPGYLQLAEVEIVSISPEEIIRRAVARIPENFGADTMVLTAFVRSQKYLGGKLGEFTEAIIGDLKTGYGLYKRKEQRKKFLTSNLTRLIRGRVVSDTTLVNAMGEVGRNAGCLGCNFTRDFAEFPYGTPLDEQLFRYYNYTMEELPLPAGGMVYRITFDQKKGVRKTLWQGEMYINAADYALLEITQKPSYEAYGQYQKKKYRRSYFLYDRPGWYLELPLMEWTVTYAKRNGRYCLSMIRTGSWLTFEHPVTGQKAKFSHRNEVVVTDITRDPRTVRSFKGDKTVGVGRRWDQVIGGNDDRFWAGYNYMPVEERLKENIKELISY
jgi:hypothetical protein